MLPTLRVLPLLLSPTFLGFTGCATRVIVEQPKPIEININFTGHLDLVIHDARENLEQITGEKPTNVVRPEDIGLPAAPSSQGSAMDLDPPALAQDYEDAWTVPVLWSTRPQTPAPRYVVLQASEQDLTKSMPARNGKIRQLWTDGLVGESHTGLLVEKGALSDEQKELVKAENADRTALYAAEAERKKVTPEEVALGYYVARLGYAKPGAWYEIRNKNTGAWEWKKWGQ